MSLLQRSLSTPGNGGYSTKYEEQSWKTKLIFETPSILYTCTVQLKVCQKWLFGKMKLLVIRSILEKKNVFHLVESWICYALLEVVVELLHD